MSRSDNFRLLGGAKILLLAGSLGQLAHNHYQTTEPGVSTHTNSSGWSATSIAHVAGRTESTADALGSDSGSLTNTTEVYVHTTAGSTDGDSSYISRDSQRR